MPRKASPRSERKHKKEPELETEIEPTDESEDSSPDVDEDEEIEIAEEEEGVADEEEVAEVIEETNRLFSDGRSLGSALSLHLRALEKYPPLNQDREIELARRAQDGDPEAIELLTLHNLRFVVAVAKKFQRPGVELDDLIQEGSEGLMRAVVRFNPDKGVKLISYAVWWIRQSIRQALNKRPSIRLPLNRVAEAGRIQKSIEKLAEETGRTPSIQEITEDTGIDADAVRDILAAQQSELSLDAREFGPQGNDGQNIPLSERIPAENGTEESLNLRTLKADIERAIEQLEDPRDRVVIRMYWGLDVGKEHTLQEIGEILGVTRERVRQVRDRAKERLKALGITQELIDHYMEI